MINSGLVRTANYMPYTDRMAGIACRAAMRCDRHHIVYVCVWHRMAARHGMMRA